MVTQANELQLDSSQLTLAIRLRPREMKEEERRKWVRGEKWLRDVRNIKRIDGLHT